MPTFPPGGFAKFYRWDNKLYFIESYCDTLYQVTQDTLFPRYYFDWGKYNAPYSGQSEVMTREHYKDYFFLSDINENKNNIFIRIIYKSESYYGFIEKKTNNITFCRRDISGISAFKDDVFFLMDVIPQSFTQKNEMIFVIQPLILLSWLKDNPVKAESAKIRLPWLKSIDKFNNPVIAIGKCKD